MARSRPYTSTQLAQLYQVDRRTFLKWIKPFKKLIGQRHGHFYTAKQVGIIFKLIGKP